MEENSYVRHHKQKIVLVLAAMRHFAETLRQRGLTVDYVKLDAPDNTGSFATEVHRAVARHRPSRFVVTEPSEWRVQALVDGWAAFTGCSQFRPADCRRIRSLSVSMRLIHRLGKPAAIVWRSVGDGGVFRDADWDRRCGHGRTGLRRGIDQPWS